MVNESWRINNSQLLPVVGQMQMVEFTVAFGGDLL
jgi:hypothetical protein